MALDIASHAYFEAVVAFAEREGCLDDLGEKLRWLDTFGDSVSTHCVMTAASLPYAFDFVMFEYDHDASRPMFVGRLVHTVHRALDGHPTPPMFAVSISTIRSMPDCGAVSSTANL